MNERPSVPSPEGPQALRDPPQGPAPLFQASIHPTGFVSPCPPRTDRNSPLCSIGHRPLWVCCPDGCRRRRCCCCRRSHFHNGITRERFEQFSLFFAWLLAMTIYCESEFGSPFHPCTPAQPAKSLEINFTMG